MTHTPTGVAVACQTRKISAPEQRNSNENVIRKTLEIMNERKEKISE